jgi:ABC-type glycerol-3-phosphate transport system substrate-binding protein
VSQRIPFGNILNESSRILGTAASEVVAGTKTAEEALNAAQVEIERIMTDAGYYE